jgi:succinoglycan biosynthesis protein ExoM
VSEVSICICTYRRPAGLLRLLRSLRNLHPSGPRHEVIVVDNDAAATGEPAVRRARAEGLAVRYLVEPVRGIARARNRSLEPATGEYVAFIDDDEEADPRWLAHLWAEVARDGGTGGVGPVLPRFGEGTPWWLIEGRFFERRRLPTGTILRAKETRTGNALVRRRPLMALPGPFDERYDFTGGEDGNLFARMIDAGARFIAVDSAIVYEHLTPARTTVRWLLRRRFREGMDVARLDGAGEPARGRRRRSLRPLAAGLGWGLWGLLLFPTSPTRGVDRLSHAARRLGWAAFLNGLSVRPYLNDSWR